MAVLTASQLAEELNTDSRTVRKFLRSVTPKDDQPGKGSRWTIEKKNLRSLRTQFTKFQAAQAEKDSTPADTEETAPEVKVIDHTANATKTH